MKGNHFLYRDKICNQAEPFGLILAFDGLQQACTEDRIVPGYLGLNYQLSKVHLSLFQVTENIYARTFYLKKYNVNRQGIVAHFYNTSIWEEEE